MLLFVLQIIGGDTKPTSTTRSRRVQVVRYHFYIALTRAMFYRRRRESGFGVQLHWPHTQALVLGRCVDHLHLREQYGS